MDQLLSAAVLQWCYDLMLVRRTYLAQPPRVFTNRKSKIAYERALKDYALFENWYLKENAIDDLVIVGYALTRGLEPYFVVKKIWEYIHNE